MRGGARYWGISAPQVGRDTPTSDHSWLSPAPVIWAKRGWHPQPIRLPKTEDYGPGVSRAIRKLWLGFLAHELKPRQDSNMKTKDLADLASHKPSITEKNVAPQPGFEPDLRLQMPLSSHR